ncbi:unnamed protein product, partial [Polarella glacialis]
NNPISLRPGADIMKGCKQVCHVGDSLDFIAQGPDGNIVTYMSLSLKWLGAPGATVSRGLSSPRACMEDGKTLPPLPFSLELSGTAVRE